MKIADVMTTETLIARPETSLKDVARRLSARGISGMPVVDEHGVVLGVVSEADILAKERRPLRKTRFAHGPGEEARKLKMDARTAGEAMTSPAITVAADRRIEVAAALMLDRGVNRLPVVDSADRLVGIVTRADLVRAFASGDDRIDREIREEVILRELWLDPREFEVSVEEGVVELSGRFESEEQREIARAQVRLVPGVVSVSIRETAPAR